MVFKSSLIEFLSRHNQKKLRLLNPFPMVSIGTKSSSTAKTSLANLSASSAGPIKKAIASAKPSEEIDATDKDEALEKNSLQNEAQENVKRETEIEKKKNLDKLLNRGLAIKKDEKTEKETDAKAAPGKDTNKEIDKEWTKNSSAKDDADKSRFEKAREDGLQDQLKYDKDSIAKKYPGLDRPGASGSPSSEAKASGSGSSNNTNNSNDNSNFNNGNNLGTGGSQGNSGNSGVSKLSDNSHNHVQPRHNLNDGGSVMRPDLNQGPRGGGFGHNDFPRDNGNSNVNRPDLGHLDHSHKAHTAFESLYTEGHIKGNMIQTGSSEDAQRITAGLRGLGVFDSIQQEGNSIRLSGFNSGISHDIHEAQRNILGQEFLAGRITNFNFEGVNESVAANLTKMLESKAQAIGSTQHSIGSDCSDGVCRVSLGQKTQNTEQNQQEQYAQNENNPNQNNQEQTA